MHSVNQDAPSALLPRLLPNEQDAKARHGENDDTRIHGDGLVNPEQHPAEHRCDHPTSACRVVSRCGARVSDGTDIRDRAEAMPQAEPRTERCISIHCPLLSGDDEV